jgi:ATP-dependent DNA ligase
MCFSGAAHDFDKLWNRTHDHEAKLCAFDLLELDGEDYRARPLIERKQRLFKLLRRAYGGLEYVEHLEGDGGRIFEHACKLGLEGIVCKRLDLPYRAGPSKSWIKVKNKSHPAMLRVKARQVVGGLRGASPWLEQQFESAAAEAEGSFAVQSAGVP